MSEVVYTRRENGLFIDHRRYIKPDKNAWYMHTHNEYELLYIISGDATHVTEDRKYKLKKHDLIIIRPNDYHFVQFDSSSDYERYEVLFNPETLGIDNINLLPKELDVLHCRHIPIITDIFKKTDYYCSVMENGKISDITSVLLKELIYNIIFSSQTHLDSAPLNINPLVSKALSYINTNLFTIKSIAEIAEELFITESYLYRVFKSELKTTPLKYITEKRLHTAQNLIIQGKPPTSVFQECGFSDYTTFYRSYVKLFSHPPSLENKI